MIEPDLEEDRLWLRNYRPVENAKAQLICLPHAGGSASFYLPFSRCMAPSIDVSIVQYPGRQDRRRESLIPSIEGFADAIGPVVGRRDGPIVLFGHSMGALVAFELARRLQTTTFREKLVGLVVSGRRSPRIVRDDSFNFDDRQVLREEMRVLSGTHEELLMDDEVLDLSLPALRNDYQAAWDYRPADGPKLSIPIAGLVGETDPRVSAVEVEAWGSETERATCFHQLEGGHFYRGSNQAELATVVDSCIGFFFKEAARWC